MPCHAIVQQLPSSCRRSGCYRKCGRSCFAEAREAGDRRAERCLARPTRSAQTRTSQPAAQRQEQSPTATQRTPAHPLATRAVRCPPVHPLAQPRPRRPPHHAQQAHDYEQARKIHHRVNQVRFTASSFPAMDERGRPSTIWRREDEDGMLASSSGALSNPSSSSADYEHATLTLHLLADVESTSSPRASAFDHLVRLPSTGASPHLRLRARQRQALHDTATSRSRTLVPAPSTSPLPHPT